MKIKTITNNQNKEFGTTIEDMEQELKIVSYILDILGNPYHESFDYIIKMSGFGSFEKFMRYWIDKNLGEGN
ncbi:MAG: hypothetical protein ACP5D2_02085 [Candidatus Nanoarchaeia archaeon]